MKDFKVRVELPALAVFVCLTLVAIRPEWPSVAGLCAGIAFALGCRLIAYRQAEDVSALAARVTKAEEEAKRALTIATAQGRAKAQGF